MDQQPELTEEQKQFKEEQLKRASAFEALSHQEGFKYQKAYYENKIKAFVNDLFNKEDIPITDFEGQRREIIGLKKMFGDIEFELQQLEAERAKENEQKPTGTTSE